jgi:hypothetical protein
VRMVIRATFKPATGGRSTTLRRTVTLRRQGNAAP